MQKSCRVHKKQQILNVKNDTVFERERCMSVVTKKQKFVIRWLELPYSHNSCGLAIIV
jgi:hypothetical protein